jgi:hypothetical protein
MLRAKIPAQWVLKTLGLAALLFWMAGANALPAVVHSAANASSGFEGTPGTSFQVTVTLPGAVTSGNAVGLTVLFGATGGTPAITSIVDDQGNTYTPNTPYNASTIPAFFSATLKGNITNAPTVITISVDSSAAATIQIQSRVYEISGTGTATLSFSTASANEIALGIVSTNNSNNFTSNWTIDDNTVAFPGMGGTVHTVLTSSGSNSLQGTPVTGSTAMQLYAATWISSASPPPTSSPNMFLLGRRSLVIRRSGSYIQVDLQPCRSPRRCPRRKGGLTA